MGGGGGRVGGRGGAGGGVKGGGGGGAFWFFPKRLLCPVRNRLWSVSLCGVGGLALHGKAARVPPPYPPPRFGGVRRERGRFSPPFPIQHAARVGGYKYIYIINHILS